MYTSTYVNKVEESSEDVSLNCYPAKIKVLKQYIIISQTQCIINVLYSLVNFLLN